MIVFPVEILLVTGTTVFGASGVLLAVAGPVICWSVPVLATVPNGRVNTTVAAVLPALATYAQSNISRRHWPRA